MSFEEITNLINLTSILLSSLMIILFPTEGSNKYPFFSIIVLNWVELVYDTLLFEPKISISWVLASQSNEGGKQSTNAYDKNTTKFTTLVEKKGYLFDPTTGNRNIVRLDNSVKARYIKLVISSNDIKGGYNAQLSEFSVYGD